MAEADVKEQSSSSEVETEKKAEESSKASEASTEKDESDESESPAQKRIRQLSQKANQAEKIVDWYRQNIGDPNDVVAFKQWKAEQLKQAKEAEEEGEISPAKLAAIRKLMRSADPEYTKLLEWKEQQEKKSQMETQARIDAMFDDAEEIVKDFADSELGLKGSKAESDISFFGQQVMLVIQNDEKLLRKWNTGNVSCVKAACQKVLELSQKTTQSLASRKRDAESKRRFLRLPILPSGGGVSTSATANPPQREKGITKQTHEDAWAIFQQASNKD